MSAKHIHESETHACLVFEDLLLSLSLSLSLKRDKIKQMESECNSGKQCQYLL
jgi:hypothetical protein